jgi:hypothetical protein
VLGGVHLGVVAKDTALGADDEGLAADTRTPGGVDLPGAISVRDLVIRVGEEREVEVELVAKRGMRGDVIGADAIDEDATAGVLGGFITEPTGLARSARGVVLRVEP